ncbi:hypothetical protein GQR58_004259 [Nymphon striatum]|nr:hypothetical protein GQR58_004259 [Nymphon striatum]
MLNILHLPNVVGGHPVALANAETRLGATSHSLSLTNSPYGYQPNIQLNIDQVSQMRGWFRRFDQFFKLRKKYDVFHFNAGSSLLNTRRAGLDLADLRYYPKNSIKIMTFQGSDSRLEYSEILEESLRAEAEKPFLEDAKSSVPRSRLPKTHAMSMKHIYKQPREIALTKLAEADIVIDQRSWSEDGGVVLPWRHLPGGDSDNYFGKEPPDYGPTFFAYFILQHIGGLVSCLETHRVDGLRRLMLIIMILVNRSSENQLKRLEADPTDTFKDEDEKSTKSRGIILSPQCYQRLRLKKPNKRLAYLRTLSLLRYNFNSTKT